MSDNPVADLLACPFCGESVEINDYTDKPACAWVMIHRCTVIGPIKMDGYSRESIAKPWNTRSDLTPASAEPVAKRWLVEEIRPSGVIRWQCVEHERHARDVAREMMASRVTALYTHPAPMTVEAADHPAIRIGDIGNYYGSLILKREGGIDYWAIENWDGDNWKECDPRVASTLRALSGEKS